MKVKILFLIFMISVLSIIGVGCGGDSSNVTGDSGNHKLVIGFDENFPPFGFIDESGNVQGFDIDLAKETMRRLGRSVEFKSIDWSDKEEKLSSGEIDMIWNGLEITDERREDMMFSKPYMHSGFIVFVRHSHQGSAITDKTKLIGLNVGIQKGSSAEMYLNEDEDLRSTIKDLKRYDDGLVAFTDLQERKIDAVICDEINGRYYIFKNDLQNKVDALDIQIGDKGGLAVGFRKTDIVLRNNVQKMLDDIIKDGTATKISEQWFGKNLID